MRKKPIIDRDNSDDGFTLIEILIVIVITSITLTFALISFGDFGQSKKVKFAAQRMVNLLKLAQEQAILEPVTLGVSVNDKGYRFYQYSGNQWQARGKSRPFQARSFPKDTTVKLIVNHNNTTNHQPNIVINSAGEITPFTLIFNNSISINTSNNGLITFKDSIKQDNQ